MILLIKMIFRGLFSFNFWIIHILNPLRNSRRYMIWYVSCYEWYYVFACWIGSLFKLQKYQCLYPNIMFRTMNWSLFKQQEKKNAKMPFNKNPLWIFFKKSFQCIIILLLLRKFATSFYVFFLLLLFSILMTPVWKCQC